MESMFLLVRCNVNKLGSSSISCSIRSRQVTRTKEKLAPGLQLCKSQGLTCSRILPFRVEQGAQAAAKERLSPLPETYEARCRASSRQQGRRDGGRPSNLGNFDSTRLRMPLPKDLERPGIFVAQNRSMLPEPYLGTS
jgi:hypothetical protein